MDHQIEQLFQAIKKLKIIVIGDIMLDHYIMGDAHRISPEAPVPVVHVGDDRYAAGGAANVALNVRSLGADCELVGCVGRDASADVLRNLMQEKGVVFSDDCVSNAVSTIVKTRVLVRNQQLCRLDREDAPKLYTMDDVWEQPAFSEKLKIADAVILSDYAKGVLTQESIEKITEIAHAQGCFVSLDPKPRRSLNFHGVDLITPNRNESLELANIRLGLHDAFPDEAVCKEIWSKHQPQNLVVTLGGEGMLLSTEGKPSCRIPTMAKEVFDVSGAGDTVIAALTSALAAKSRLEVAADFANHAAGVVVGKLGTATATPEEVHAHWQSAHAPE